jgi:hypothetical protein
MQKTILIQFYVLLAGTLFAWGNFGFELYNFLNQKVCQFGCSVGLKNPVYTPCFYGALFFTLAFILNIIITNKVNKNYGFRKN